MELGANVIADHGLTQGVYMMFLNASSQRNLDGNLLAPTHTMRKNGVY